MQVRDAKCLITGAGGGLGRHFALRLLESGAAVAAGDVNAAGLRSLRKEAGDVAGRLHLAQVDVTDEEAVEGFVAESAEALGGLNGAIHCAGILRDGLLVSREQEGGLRKLPLALWRRVLDVNLTGGFLLTRELASHCLENGVSDAFVIHMSSLSRSGNPGQASYAASKAGLDAAMRTWALELAERGIRVASIAPGVVSTPFLEGIGEKALDHLVGSIPLGRVGTPEEVWAAVRFIIECGFFTGRVLEVDGGSSMSWRAGGPGGPGGES